MNLPNKLTLLRVFMVPIFLLLMYLDIKFNLFLALAVFAAASITDAVDGHLARKHNLVTNFGKFMDPLADKVLVTSALICFLEMGYMGKFAAIAVIIIIAREFAVSGLRLITAGEGVVVAAGIWGKLKTAATMVTIVFILAMQGVIKEFDISSSLCDTFNIISIVLIWICTVLTVFSGITYLNAYKSYIDPTE